MFSTNTDSQIIISIEDCIDIFEEIEFLEKSEEGESQQGSPPSIYIHFYFLLNNSLNSNRELEGLYESSISGMG